jgi:hypothetical protein
MFDSKSMQIVKYDPAGWIPYDHVFWADSREGLVLVSIHVLMALLDYSPEPLPPHTAGEHTPMDGGANTDLHSDAIADRRSSVEMAIQEPVGAPKQVLYSCMIPDLYIVYESSIIKLTLCSSSINSATTFRGCTGARISS